MTTSVWLRIRWLLRLWILLVATPFNSPAIFAYNASQQAMVAYDGRAESAIGYGAVSVLIQRENKNATNGDRVLFAKFAKFLAAERVAVGESRALVPYYPPNSGFAGASGEATLVPGTIVDRYGGTGGRYLSPQGTPPWARSLQFGAETRSLNAYEVVRPIDVNAGTVAPWFNQPGGGVQFKLGTGTTVQDLINSGHLRPLQ